jgi:lysophospholipase L1-like esterase
MTDSGRAFYGLVPSRPTGVRVVPWGDSTTAADTGRYPATSWGTRDFWAWGHVLSGGAFRYIQNAGLAGDDSGEALPRFATDVAAYAPNVVPIAFGINDAVSGLSLATFKANIQQMVALVRGIKATPWLCTVSGNLNSGVIQQRIAQYNLWLRTYAAAEGIPLLDIAAVMTDPATGTIPTAYNLDGTHQNAAGAKALGQQVAALVTRSLPVWSPPLPVSNTADSQNLLTNALFLTNTAGVPTGWLNTLGTPSIITGDTAIKGNWARLTDNGVATSNLRFNSVTGIAAGDVIRFCGRYRQVQGTSVATSSLYLMLFAPTNRQALVLGAQAQDIDGAFTFDVVAPTGFTSWQVQLARTCTTAGTGYSQIAQMGVYNLTTLGLT